MFQSLSGKWSRAFQVGSRVAVKGGAACRVSVAALGSRTMSTWGRVLKVIKCPGEADRLEAIAEILSCNGLASILDLRCASDPVAWKRFSDLLPAEVAFFRSLVTAAKPQVPAAAHCYGAPFCTPLGPGSP